jgi:hypothetical protein
VRWVSSKCFLITKLTNLMGTSIGVWRGKHLLALTLGSPMVVYHERKGNIPWNVCVITNVKGTFLGMSESEETPKRCLFFQLK